MAGHWVIPPGRHLVSSVQVPMIAPDEIANPHVGVDAPLLLAVIALMPYLPNLIDGILHGKGVLTNG